MPNLCKCRASLHSSSHPKLKFSTSLREILENLFNSYCLSKRGVAMHPKVSRARIFLFLRGPTAPYCCRSRLECAWPNVLRAASVELAKNVSQLRKKPKLPYAEKTQVGSVPSLSARVKHLVGADSRKVGGTRSARDVLLKPPADKFENYDLHCRIALVESRAVKCGVDSASLTSLEVRMTAAKETRESSPWAKGSSATLATDPKVDKSSPTGDEIVSDLLKTNFLSSSSACFKLVDHIHQAGDLETVSSLSLEK
ncbi:unnamed protein product [Prunus brigantina]